MKLGIVGSSFSYGKVVERGTQRCLSSPLEVWFKDIDVINCAASSKGTELYLDKVIFLKKNYQIDTLLLESVNNRSMWNIKCTPESYKIIYHEDDIEKIISELYLTSDGIWKYQKFLTQPMEHQKFGSDDQYNNWLNFQTNMATYESVNEFWGMVDIAQTINLCNMLDIKVLLWANRWSMESLPSFNSVIKNHSYVKFGKYVNAYEYYKNKYGEKNILCDGIHFNDKTNEEMVNDFILPALTKLK